MNTEKELSTAIIESYTVLGIEWGEMGMDAL